MSKKKKKKRARGLQHAAEYAVLRVMVAALGWMGPVARMRVSRRLGPLMARFVPVRRALIIEHLRLVAPDRDDAGRSALLREVYTNLIAFGLELLVLARLDKCDLAAGIDLPIRDNGWLERIKASERGCVIVAGHMGNWEWGGAMLGVIGLDPVVVFKPQHNPLVDRYVRQMRERFGLSMAPTRESPLRLFRHLKRGGTVGVMADQDARHDGIFVPFFGKEASTAAGPARLAYRMNVPLLALWATRSEKGLVIVTADEPIYPNPEAPAEEEIERMTRYHVESLERAVRADPGQYFWLHRRWKTRPKGEKDRTEAEEGSR